MARTFQCSIAKNRARAPRPRSPDVIRQKPENIGEILRGDRIKTSPYVAYAMEDHYCNVLCRIDSLSADQMQAFVEKIQDEYRAYMILDNLPLATGENVAADVAMHSGDRACSMGHLASKF